MSMQSTYRRPVFAALYGVAALLVIVPMLETLAGAWPFRPGEVNWRFGIIGITLKSIVSPLLGLGLMMGISVVLDHRRVARALAVLSFLVAIMVVATAAIFALDFLQLRTTVVANMRPSVDLAAVIALAIAGFAAPVSLGLGIGGWSAARRMTAVHAKVQTTATTDVQKGLIVSHLKERST